MIDWVSVARPVLAGRDALGDAAREGLDAVASDPDVDAGPSARFGATLLSADSTGDVVAGLDATASETSDAVGETVTGVGLPSWLGPAVFAAIATVVVAALSYALGQLFSFNVDL